MSTGGAVGEATSGKPVFNRIMLKISGEALMGSGKFGIDPAVVVEIAEEIKQVHDLGVEVAVVVVAVVVVFAGAPLSWVAGAFSELQERATTLAATATAAAKREPDDPQWGHARSSVKTCRRHEGHGTSMRAPWR